MKKMSRSVKLYICLVIFGFFLGSEINASCSLQGVTSEDFQPLRSDFNSFKDYSSLAPRLFIKVSYDSFVSPMFFDSKQKANFIIVKDGDDCKERLNVEKFMTFKGFNYLVFDAKSNGLTKTDKLNIGILVDVKDNSGKLVQRILMWDSTDGTTRKKIPLPAIDSYTLTASPNIAPEQELTDGTKKTVGQLKLGIDVPSLITNNKIGRFYFNTDNFISTNWKDKNSKVEMKFGAETNLFRTKWFVPVYLETKANGDQRMKNATFIAASGIKTILPWTWTKPLLFNSAIRAPISPEFGLKAEYYRRIKQDASSLAKFPRKDSFALAGEFSWNPIQLFTGSCLKKDEQGNLKLTPATNQPIEDFEQCLSAQNISLELSGKGWWFPYEKSLTGTKVKRFEGRGEISLLIPIRNIANQFLLKKESEKAASRVRIKYVIGANDAAGFKKVSQLTFGIELIK